MHRKIKRFVLGVIVVFVLALGGLYLASLGASQPSFFIQNGPNGYLLYEEAAQKMEASSNSANLRAINLSENPEAMRLWKAAQTMPSEAPLNYYDMYQALPLLSAQKFLMFAARNHAKKLEENSNWKEAADFYCDLVRYGIGIQHGPIINAMNGLLGENLGVTGLSGVLPHLSDNERAEVCKTIQTLVQARPTISSIKERENFLISNYKANFLIKSYMKLFGLKPQLNRLQGKFSKANASAKALCSAHSTVEQKKRK
jgi:hypothetical protein